MTDFAIIREIVSVYERNDWILRIFALRRQTRQKLGSAIAEAYPAVPIADSVTDAAWFSRKAGNASGVWEIRHLGEMPYALLTEIDGSQRDTETTLREFEQRLQTALESRRTS
jgi:hypothetical protein